MFVCKNIAAGLPKNNTLFIYISEDFLLKIKYIVWSEMVGAILFFICLHKWAIDLRKSMKFQEHAITSTFDILKYIGIDFRSNNELISDKFTH